jgi:hypothetical protein
MTEKLHPGYMGCGFCVGTGNVVPGIIYTEYTTLNIWAPSQAKALEPRRRSRSLSINFVTGTKFIMVKQKEELRFAGGAKPGKAIPHFPKVDLGNTAKVEFRCHRGSGTVPLGKLQYIV